MLQSEIRRSADARYHHRLHAVLLVAQGMTCPQVGRMLGDAPRTVEYWVHRFERDGLQVCRRAHAQVAQGGSRTDSWRRSAGFCVVPRLM